MTLGVDQRTMSLEQHIQFQCYVDHDMTPRPAVVDKMEQVFPNTEMAECIAKTVWPQDVRLSKQTAVKLRLFRQYVNWSRVIYCLLDTKKGVFCYGSKQGCPNTPQELRFFEPN